MKTLNETALVQNDAIAFLDMELSEMEGDVSDAYLAELARRVSLAHGSQSQEETIYGWVN